jgi:uroporphyrinogen-III synthase
MSLANLKILALESRRADDFASLIRRQGGDPFIAPSVREKSIEDRSSALAFVNALEEGSFDIVVCMTGVGLTFLQESVDAKRVGAALRNAAIISRGTKPVPILRSLGVPIAEVIPEPNTWREVLTSIERRLKENPGLRIAIQEYGRTNQELNDALLASGAHVHPFAFYRWELPENTAPLREAAQRLAQGDFDLVFFTSSIQLDHLLAIAEVEHVRDAVVAQLRNRVLIASIGPVMSDSLRAKGYPVDLEPQSPKMGALVKVAAEEAHQRLAAKRMQS